MQRIEAIRHIAQVVTKDDLLTTSIGQTWDDWWNHKPADNTFFTGILGSVTTTALGLAVSLPHRRIIAIETDGSVLLNTGVMCTLGKERPPNLTVVVMDNGIYENIGGPPTHTSANTDLAKMAAPVASIASPPAGRTSSTGSCGACSATIRWATWWPRSSPGPNINGNGRTARRPTASRTSTGFCDTSKSSKAW
jgi:hypothetical protein